MLLSLFLFMTTTAIKLFKNIKNKKKKTSPGGVAQLIPFFVFVCCAELYFSLVWSNFFVLSEAWEDLKWKNGKPVEYVSSTGVELLAK